MQEQVIECKQALPQMFGAIREDMSVYEYIEEKSGTELDQSKKKGYEELLTVYNARMCASLLSMDLVTCVLAMPDQSKTHYESRFFIKHIRGSIHEGYILLCRKRGAWSQSLLYKLGAIASEYVHNPELKSLFDQIKSAIDVYDVDLQYNTFRNLTFHYTEELKEVHAQNMSITSDDALKEAAPFIRVLGKIIELTRTMELVILHDKAITLPNATIEPLPINDTVHKAAADRVQQSGLTIELLNQSITGLAYSISKIVEDQKIYAEIEDIAKKFSELCNKLGLDELSLDGMYMHTSSNVYLALYFMAVEYSTILKAYLRSNSMIERTLHLRRIHACGYAMLDILYKTDRTSGMLSDCYWKVIKDGLLSNGIKNQRDLDALEAKLSDLKNSVLDLRSRHVFVHYFKGHNANIKELVDDLKNMNPMEMVLIAQIMLNVLLEIKGNLDEFLLFKVEESQDDKAAIVNELIERRKNIGSRLSKLKEHPDMYEKMKKYLEPIDVYLKEYENRKVQQQGM